MPLPTSPWSNRNILFVEERSLLTEGSELYDKVILNALYGQNPEEKSVPTTKSKYKFGGTSTFDVQVQSDDLEIWKKLWSVKPPKAGKEVGSAGSLGVGNGEIALYWLYQYSNSGADVTMGRDGDDPDLFFNGKGVEVKAYDKHTGLLGLGRFGADKENLRLLGMIFGLNALVKVLGKILRIEYLSNPDSDPFQIDLKSILRLDWK